MLGVQSKSGLLYRTCGFALLGFIVLFLAAPLLMFLGCVLVGYLVWRLIRAVAHSDRKQLAVLGIRGGQMLVHVSGKGLVWLRSVLLPQAATVGNAAWHRTVDGGIWVRQQAPPLWVRTRRFAFWLGGRGLVASRTLGSMIGTSLTCAGTILLEVLCGGLVGGLFGAMTSHPNQIEEGPVVLGAIAGTVLGFLVGVWRYQLNRVSQAG